MGGSSSKTVFGIKRKKKTPLGRAWGRLKGALPNKKRRRKKSILSLDKLSLDNLRREGHSQKRFSIAKDKKASISKRLSLGNGRKESVSVQTFLPGKKGRDRDGTGKIGEEIKKRFSIPNLKT